MAVSLPTTAATPLTQQLVQAESLPLKAGQVVEARVVSSGQGGTVQLAIGEQLVEAALQVRLQQGTLIRLLVQGATPNLRLTVLPQQSQAAPQKAAANAPLPQPAAVQPRPEAAVSLQPRPQTHAPSRPAAQSAPQALPQSQPRVAAGQRPAPQSASPSASPSAPTAATVRPVPTPQGASAEVATGQRPVAVSVGQSAVSVAPSSEPVAGQRGTVAAFRPLGVTVPLANASNPAAPAPVAAQPLPAGTVFQLQTIGTGHTARHTLVPLPPHGAGPAPGRVETAPKQVSPGAVSSPVQQALAQTVQGSVFRQDSIVALLTNLAGLGARLSDLPKPVAQAGAELLRAQLKVDGKSLDGATLRQALQRSGVLFENALGKGGTAPPQGDIKSGLLKLATALRTWLGDAAPAKSASDSRPPPPTPGAPPRAERPSAMPQPSNLAPRDAGARLLGQADAALARMRLTQISSLPDVAARAGQGTAGASPEVSMELPLLFGGELSVGQFQILRDGEKGSARDRDGAWKMRFSINFSRTGEVGATVSLRGRKVGVMLWAERDEIAETLEDMTGELEQSLIAHGLQPGAIRCRKGPPPGARRSVGAFMDDRT